jgi:transcriptional regulator with XRE-family HTH domain
MSAASHNLDALLTARKVPIKRIAAACDISEGTVRNWRKGVHGIDSDKLPILAATLGVSVNELMGWTEDVAA